MAINLGHGRIINSMMNIHYLMYSITTVVYFNILRTLKRNFSKSNCLVGLKRADHRFHMEEGGGGVATALPQAQEYCKCFFSFFFDPSVAASSILECHGSVQSCR